MLQRLYLRALMIIIAGCCVTDTIAWYLDHAEWMEHVTSGAYQDYYRAMYEGR